jgi:uncharacterized membrane protein
MDYLVLIMRLIHILGGMFWVGGSLVLNFFVSPTVAATSESGQKFMAHLITKTRLTAAITGSAMLTVLAGIVLYWNDSQGFTSAWQSSGPGTGFGLGGFFAIIGLVFGIMVGKNVNILGKLASQIQGKPTNEQMGQIQAAQKQLRYAAPISSAAVIIALICMATARYWLLK